MASGLKHEVDGVLITGGIAHDKYFSNQVISYTHRIAPVHVYPGEVEMAALAMNGIGVKTGEIPVKSYE